MPTSAPKRKKVVILGSTGSIGTSALMVAKDIPERMEVVGLAAHRSAKKVAEQAQAFGVRQLALGDAAAAESLRADCPPGTTVYSGDQGLVDLVEATEADMVLIAIVGTSGLKPALAAIRAGRDIAVASKEILVMAGEPVMAAAREYGVHVLPVDSEHNAIYQCLEGRDPSSVRRLILTASGGPFREMPSRDFAGITVEQALNHPTWKMGPKITIDSSTLFNKGLEMIEARWLFDVGMDRVDVLVHPQSIIHSMVEFVDSSILAQLSHSDMCFPIQYAVTWPERVTNSLRPLELAELGRLDFEPPRWDDFPALELAREAGAASGTLPAVLNAANEVSVENFLAGRLSYPGISETVAATMGDHCNVPDASLDEIIAADAWAREQARARITPRG